MISKSPQATPDVDEELLARLADLYSKDDWFSARLSEAVQTEKMVDGAAADTAAGMTGKASGAGRRLPGSGRRRGAHGGRLDAQRRRSGGCGHRGQRLGYPCQSGRRQGRPRAAAGGARQGLTSRWPTSLGPLWPQTAVLVVTEFGRTAAMNGTRGTDHGTGGCAFLVGRRRARRPRDCRLAGP